MKKDCLIQGFILDGFPKNLSQVQSLEELKVHPNFLFVLDNDENSSGESTKTVRTWKDVLKVFESTPKYSNLIFKISCGGDQGNILEKISFHLENS